MRESGPLGSARTSALALALGLLAAPGVASSATISPTRPYTYDTSGVVDIGANPASVDGTAVLQFQGVDGIWFHPGSGQAVGLGQFVAVPSTLTPGQTTTYSDTPFEVEIQAPEFDKTNKVPILDNVFPGLGKSLSLKTVVENSLLLSGHLDGTVSANGQVNVVATVDSIKLGSLDAPTSDHKTHYAFPMRFSQLVLPSGWQYSTTGSLTLHPPSGSTGAATSTSTMSPMIPAGATTTTTVQPAPSAASSAIAQPQFIAGAATTPTTAPEPSTIVVFGVVIGGLAAARRRASAR